MEFEATIESVNTVLQYTGFRFFIGIPPDKQIFEWERGDVKVGFKWYGFGDILEDVIKNLREKEILNGMKVAEMLREKRT